MGCRRTTSIRRLRKRTMANEIDDICTDVLLTMGCQTVGEFKELKKKELDDVFEAVRKYQRGCAYTPGYRAGMVDVLVHVTDRLQDHVHKEWPE
jgi:hypothetical protein